MPRLNLPKKSSLVLMALLYAYSAAIGVLAFWVLTFPRFGVEVPDIIALLIADLAAMTVIWMFDIIYVNVSVYDPYWSVAPPVMFVLYAIYRGQVTLPVVLLLIAVLYWGVRLTYNWARSFKGMGHEDWRYAGYREKLSKAAFAIINLFGFVLMPTLLVFACMIPGFRLFDAGVGANVLTWLGFLVCIASATVQLVADKQSYRFRQTHPGQVCNAGLWKRGRHPNYFGEITMWWGIWVMYASLCGMDWLVLCPVAMTALFLFISIPMMERRQLANKPGYADYKAGTRMLI